MLENFVDIGYPIVSISDNALFDVHKDPKSGGLINKLTVTEQLLLFGGAIQMAGTVKARKSSRHATSDWMKMEKERGISVTSFVIERI